MRQIKPLINISYRQAISFAAFLVLYEFLTYISNDMIMPGMHQVIGNFHAPESNIATSVTAFMLGGSSLQLFLGPLSDAYGRRKIMLIGVLIFLLSTLLLAFSQNMMQFMIERFFQGMGICFIGAVGYATLQEIFNNNDAVKLTAFMANLSIIAPLLGPLLGAFIIFYASWRLIFLLIVGLTAIAFLGLYRYMPESLGQTTTENQLIAPQALDLKQIYRNYKTLFQSGLFRNTVLMYGLMGIPCMIWIALSPVMIISPVKNSLLFYGLWQIPMFSSFILANTLLQKWIDKIGMERLMNVGIMIVITSLASGTIFLHFFGLSFQALVPVFVLYFFGYAIASSPIYRKLFSATRVGKGTTGALISLTTMLIQSVGIEIGNIMYDGQNYMALGQLFLILSMGITLFYYQLNKADNRELAQEQSA